MLIYAKLQSSRVRHQYGIFDGKSQTSFTRNATRAGSEERRQFSQATQKENIGQVDCVVPENIHDNPLMEGFFSLNPPPLRKFHFSVILLLKKLGF